MRCKASGTTTRDHVVPRVLLKLQLSRDEYHRWSTEARYVNIQPLCADCNGLKGGRAADYRTVEEHAELLDLIAKWGIKVEWEDI